jgi:hypothetical protein
VACEDVSVVTTGDAGEAELASERRRRTEVRHRPPGNEVPGSLALERIIGRTEDLVVVLAGGRLYSGGIDFDVVVLQRNADDSRDEDHALVEQAFADGASAASGTALLLGVEYSDGRTTTNLRFGRHTFAGGDGDDDALCMMSGGGGGGPGNVRMRFWLTPPPPAGDLLVVCAWPHRGIPETRTVVAASDLERARGHLSELWPWEPEPERAQRQPPAPPVLPAGWFAEAWQNQELS